MKTFTHQFLRILSAFAFVVLYTHVALAKHKAVNHNQSEPIALRVDSISTDAGTPGLTPVLIYGSNLHLTDSIAFGDVFAKSFTVTNQGAVLRVVVPEEANTGMLSIYSAQGIIPVKMFYVQAVRAATPFIIPIGGTYQHSQLITIITTTPDAEIYYTTNGMTPVIGTAFTKKYTGPFYQVGSGHIRAVSIRPGLLRSRVRWERYTILEPSVVAPVEITPAGGSYNSAKTLTLSTETPDAEIYYTTNGMTPTIGSTFTFKYEGPFTIGNPSVQVKAFAVKSGLLRSMLTTEQYFITNAQQVATPVMWPPASSVSAYPIGTAVSIATSTPGATIYYTLDGSVPQPWSASTQVYTQPIILNRHERITARALKTDMLNSQIVRGVYRVSSSLGRFAFADEDNAADNVDHTVTIYPNPAKDEVKINMAGSTFRKLMVYDTHGRLILHRDVNNEQSQIITIDLCGLKTGIYLVKLIGDDVVSEQKLIVQ